MSAHRDIHHFINGKAVPGGSGRFGDVYDPNTGEVQAKVALASVKELDEAVLIPDRAENEVQIRGVGREAVDVNLVPCRRGERDVSRRTKLLLPA